MESNNMKGVKFCYCLKKIEFLNLVDDFILGEMENQGVPVDGKTPALHRGTASPGLSLPNGEGDLFLSRWDKMVGRSAC